MASLWAVPKAAYQNRDMYHLYPRRARVREQVNKAASASTLPPYMLRVGYPSPDRDRQSPLHPARYYSTQQRGCPPTCSSGGLALLQWRSGVGRAALQANTALPILRAGYRAHGTLTFGTRPSLLYRATYGWLLKAIATGLNGLVWVRGRGTHVR